MLRRSSLLAARRRGSDRGCWPGCRTTTHPASPRIRSSGPTTATSSCGFSASRRSRSILFHELGARMGVVTGQGLTGLMRERYGVRLAALGVLALLVANIGTTCAEFAGVAASLDLAGVSRYASVPVAAVAHLGACPAAGRFHRVEHVFLLMSTLLATYIVAGVRDRAGLGSRRPRPARAERARDASRSPRHHGDRRNDVGSLGARVHPVLRRRQEARRGGPALRADRCRHRCGDDRSHRLLRRRHLRGHAPSTGDIDQGRGGRRQRPRTARGTIRLASSSAPAFSAPPSLRLRSCRSQRRTRSAKCSGRRPRSTTRSARLPSSTGHSRSSSLPPVRSCSSRGRRLSRSSISHRR